MLVVILESDRDYADLARDLVSQLPGLEAAVVTSLELLWQRIRQEPPAAILADRELLRGLRGVASVRSMSTAPLVVTTSEIAETAPLMEAGADYVLPRPYPPAVLKATLTAILRRRQAERRGAGRAIEVGPLVVEPSRRSARIEGKRHFLSPREADLLEYLAVNSGAVVSRYQIIDGAWGGDPRTTPQAVTMCMHRLRQKLETDPKLPQLLRTHRSGGYFLQPAPAEPHLTPAVE
ncbi:MAG: response regulator transcription factor [Candidatus Dormibacteria bacterium]